MFTMKAESEIKKITRIKKDKKKNRFNKLQYLEINFMTPVIKKNPVSSVNILGKKKKHLKLSTLPTLIFWGLLNIFKAFF